VSVNDVFWTLPTNLIIKPDALIINSFKNIDQFDSKYNFEEISQTKITLITNPARDYTTILIKGFEKNIKMVTVMNLTGKMIFSINIEANQNRLELDLKTLCMRTGIYLIRVNDAFKQKTEQLMIER
jgi:hypothetical protein